MGKGGGERGTNLNPLYVVNTGWRYVLWGTTEGLERGVGWEGGGRKKEEGRKRYGDCVG